MGHNLFFPPITKSGLNTIMAYVALWDVSVKQCERSILNIYTQMLLGSLS